MRKDFFDIIRGSLFKSKISQSQVEGIDAILDVFRDYGTGHDADLAYILATAFHETGSRMVPVREGFASTNDGAIAAVTKLFDKGRISTNYAKPDHETGCSYYGRGHVQVTWKDNYKRIGKCIDLDLVNNPDLLLDMTASAKALVIGCQQGLFSGKKLSDYLPDDPEGARRVVNGTDKKDLIAGYHHDFLDAIESAGGAGAIC